MSAGENNLWGMRQRDPRSSAVERWLDAHNRSVRWLSESLGVNNTSVNDWVTGKSRPRDEQVWERIAGILKSAEEELARVQAELPDSVAERSNVVTESRDTADAWRNLAIAPIRSWSSANAYGVGATTMFERSGIDNVPSVFLVGGIASADRHDVVRVSGDSLSPRVESGQRLVIYRDPTMYANSIVLAKSPDGDAYLKVLRREGPSWRLRSVNPNGSDFADLDGWEVLGYAVARLGSETEDDGRGFNVEWRSGAPLRA